MPLTEQDPRGCPGRPTYADRVIRVLGIDGDDTLWRNEELFRAAEEEFTRLATRWAHGDHVRQRLLDTERRNLATFGYGVKGFVLSMIETAIELSAGEVPAADIHRIIELGRTLLDQPVHLLDGVGPVIAALAHSYRLVLITKGDLMHQETKVAASGLAEHFWRIEIVSEKDPDTYRHLLERHGVAAAEFVMVGNSVRSDVLPVLEIGARAVHIPYHLTWELEQAGAADAAGARFPTIAHLGELADLLERWSA